MQPVVDALPMSGSVNEGLRKPPYSQGLRWYQTTRHRRPPQGGFILVSRPWHNLRDLALFNLAIDSNLRGCDLVCLKVVDLVVGDRVRDRATVIQSKTKRPVQFEVSENTRDSIWTWVCGPEMHGCVCLFPSRLHDQPHVSTRQYARLVRYWVSAIGLDPSGCGTHSLRRTKAAQIYRKTGNLRAVQLLLGHAKVDSKVRYLGVELEDALSIAEKIDI